MLSAVEIERARRSGRLSIDRDEGEVCVQPSSIDLHLGREYGTFAYPEEVDVTDESTYPTPITYEEDSFTIQGHGFVLAHTEERVSVDESLSGILHGRSSVGRLGLFVHNAGFVDAGFSGQLVLELFNAAPYPITLHSGMRICQLTLAEHDWPPSVDYGETGKYGGQSGVQTSKLYEDFHNNA